MMSSTLLQELPVWFQPTETSKATSKLTFNGKRKHQPPAGPSAPDPADYVVYQQMDQKPDPELCNLLRDDIRKRNQKKVKMSIQQAAPLYRDRFESVLRNPSVLSVHQQADSQRVELLVPPANKDLLTVIHKALIKFRDQGKKLKNLKIYATPKAVDKVLGNTGLMFLNETKTVFINPGLVLQAEPDKVFWKHKAFPVPNLQDAVEHEIVHFLHQKNDPLNYAGLAIGEFKPHAKEIASEVSDYATTDPYEFVAEAGLGLLNGKRYSQPVMKMYEALKGPGFTQTPVENLMSDLQV